MPKITAKNLLEQNCSDLSKLLDALINLAKDRGYLGNKNGFENTLSEIDELLLALRNRILELAHE